MKRLVDEEAEIRQYPNSRAMMKKAHISRNIDFLLKKGFLSVSIVLTKWEGNAFMVQKGIIDFQLN